MSPDEQTIERRLDEEKARDRPPAAFPILPEIPGGRYNRPDFLALEQEHVFRKCWMLACMADQLAAPGDYRRFDRLGVPIFIVRDRDGGLRAFYNSCRHRGAPVVREACGRATLLRCQYHSWAYALDGRLVAVPDEKDFPGLDRAARGLVPVRCAQWGPLVFVNLDPDAVPLRDYLGALADELGFFEGVALRTVHEEHYESACNWKAAADAFNEVYHIKTIHPGTGAVTFDTDATTVSLFANGHARSTTRKTVEGRTAFDRRAKLFVPGMPDFFHRNVLAYSLFPNGSILVDPTGLTIQTVWPVGLRAVHVESAYLGLDWGDAPRPRFWDSYLEIMDGVWKEDLVNLAPIQASLDSGAFTSIVPNYQERRISWYHEEIDRRIGASNIPPGLAVGAVLAPHAEAAIRFAPEPLHAAG